MKRILSVTLLISGLFWSVNGQSSKSGSTASVEVVDGVEYIHNTETPLHPGNSVGFIEELSIGPEDSDGNINFYNPLLHCIDEIGNIYISEFQDKVIKIFNPDGKLIRTVGAKGQGPGEFNSISYFTVTKDGKLIAYDQVTRRLSVFNKEGQFVRSYKWRMSAFNFILLKKSSLIINEIIYTQDRQLGAFDVKEIDFQGKLVRYFDGDFTPGKWIVIRKGDASFYMSLPVNVHSLFIGDQNRKLFYHCINNRYVIEVFDVTGTLLRKIDRPYIPVPFIEEDAKEYRAKYENDPFGVTSKAAKTMKMPKVKSVISRMFVDDKSNLWIRTNEKKEKDGKTLTAFDIFNPAGYYYVRIWMEFISPYFQMGKMYRMETDRETGYQTLKRYKIIWE